MVLLQQLELKDTKCLQFIGPFYARKVGGGRNRTSQIENEKLVAVFKVWTGLMSWLYFSLGVSLRMCIVSFLFPISSHRRNKAYLILMTCSLYFFCSNWKQSWICYICLYTFFLRVCPSSLVGVLNRTTSVRSWRCTAAVCCQFRFCLWIVLYKYFIATQHFLIFGTAS